MADIDPHDIPSDYCETKHRALAKTIAQPADLDSLDSPEMHVMACHETDDAHCIGWLMNQLGPGNNFALRMCVRSCENIDRVRLRGAQHQTVEDTVPAEE